MSDERSGVVMQYNDTPFFEHITEHQFADEETEKVISVKEYEEQLREAEERGARKERRKIRRERQEIYEDKKRGKFYRIAGILFCALAILGFSCLYKYLVSKFSNIDYVWFSTIVLGILVTIWGCIAKDEKLKTCRAENEGFFQGAWEGCIEICIFVTKNRLTAVLLTLCIVIFGGGIAGKFNVFDRFAIGCRQFVTAFINYESEMDGEWKLDEVAEEKISE